MGVLILLHRFRLLFGRVAWSGHICSQTKRVDRSKTSTDPRPPLHIYSLYVVCLHGRWPVCRDMARYFGHALDHNHMR